MVGYGSIEIEVAFDVAKCGDENGIYSDVQDAFRLTVFTSEGEATLDGKDLAEALRNLLFDAKTGSGSTVYQDLMSQAAQDAE